MTQTNALLHSEEAENVDIGTTKTTNLELISAPEKRINLFRIKRGIRDVNLYSYRNALTCMKDPCIFIDRREKMVYIDDGANIRGVKRTTRPHRSEPKAVSFKPAPVVGEEDVFAVRVSCLKSVFSDSLQFRIHFEDKRGVMHMHVYSIVN